MIINPIYLNSKNSEENDWNPYVMEEDKMLDLTDYTFINIFTSTDNGYAYFLYDNNWNTGIKANANTTLIVYMYNSGLTYLNALKLVGYNAPPSSYPTAVSAQTNKLLFTLKDYIKIKLPSSFNSKYLGFYTDSGTFKNNMITNYLSVAIKDYDT